MSTTTDLLNRLLAVVSRSFPQYLQYARPYVPVDRKDVVEVLESVVADQSGMADRIARMICDGQGLPKPGDFPLEFTGAHDLGIDYLVGMATGYQRQDIAAIQQIVEGLRFAPAAKSLAEETLGLAKGHLQSLEELLEEKEMTNPPHAI